VVGVFLCFSFFISLSGSTGIGLRNLVLARQAVCCLRHEPVPFCFGYFQIGSVFMLRLAWTSVLLFLLPV
jgi:hypothetical protein